MLHVVLLSGGLDSVAALHWAVARGPVCAIGFSYGQPHRDAELTAAGTIAARRAVPFEVLILPEMRRLDPSSGVDTSGISIANVPARNAIFLTRAASHAARQGVDVRLVVGFNSDDAATFPDCRQAFVSAAENMLRTALAGICNVSVAAPWISMRKAEIIAWSSSHPDALTDIRESVSCYRGTRCGQCDACDLRVRAFKEAGIGDGATGAPAMFGGDPARDARLA